VSSCEVSVVASAWSISKGVGALPVLGHGGDHDAGAAGCDDGGERVEDVHSAEEVDVRDAFGGRLGGRRQRRCGSPG
jgi:hypothetical protein